MKTLLALVLAVGSAAAEPPRRIEQSPPLPPPIDQECSFDEHVQISRESFALGMFAKSLVEAERALRCNPNKEAMMLAAVAACELHNDPKLRLYLPRLGFLEKVQFLLRSSCTLELPPQP